LYSWRERYGCANEHNGRVPRDFWLEDWEKQAIIGFHRKNPLEGYRRLTFMIVVLANSEVADNLGVALLPSIPLFASVAGAGGGFLGFLSPPRYLVWVASFLYWAKMKGRRRSAALHSGPDSAFGSHPCVALSSGRQLDGKAFVGPPPLWPIRDKSQGARGTASPH